MDFRTGYKSPPKTLDIYIGCKPILKPADIFIAINIHATRINSSGGTGTCAAVASSFAGDLYVPTKVTLE